MSINQSINHTFKFYFIFLLSSDFFVEVTRVSFKSRFVESHILKYQTKIKRRKNSWC